MSIELQIGKHEFEPKGDYHSDDDDVEEGEVSSG
jgi:hypothetical protein